MATSCVLLVREKLSMLTSGISPPRSTPSQEETLARMLRLPRPGAGPWCWLQRRWPSMMVWERRLQRELSLGSCSFMIGVRK